jgi:hypothetical protein
MLWLPRERPQRLFFLIGGVPVHDRHPDVDAGEVGRNDPCLCNQAKNISAAVAEAEPASPWVVSQIGRRSMSSTWVLGRHSFFFIGGNDRHERRLREIPASGKEAARAPAPLTGGAAMAEDPILIPNQYRSLWRDAEARHSDEKRSIVERLLAKAKKDLALAMAWTTPQ